MTLRFFEPCVQKIGETLLITERAFDVCPVSNVGYQAALYPDLFILMRAAGQCRACAIQKILYTKKNFLSRNLCKF